MTATDVLVVVLLALFVLGLSVGAFGVYWLAIHRWLPSWDQRREMESRNRAFARCQQRSAGR